MRFCWSTLRVNDLDESIEFYQNFIGVQVVSRMKIGTELEIAFLGKGETQVELICDGTERKTSTGGTDISWGFEVDSLDDVLEQVKDRGIPIASGPVQPNPHVRYFFIKDPNGMMVQFVENIK